MIEPNSRTEFPDCVSESSATTSGAASTASGDVDVADLQRRLDEATPRLEALAQLEALAEAQATTPEAIALQASIDVLKVEEADRRAELRELEEAIAGLQAANQRHVEERDMLIKQQEEIREDIVIVLDEHTTIVDQMAELIDELESIRTDAVRLLGEKASLERRVQELRDEVETLGASTGRRSSDRSGRDLDVVLEDEDEATAFDRFFEAEIVHDKARAWMLE